MCGIHIPAVALILDFIDKKEKMNILNLKGSCWEVYLLLILYCGGISRFDVWREFQNALIILMLWFDVSFASYFLYVDFENTGSGSKIIIEKHRIKENKFLQAPC